MRQSVEEWSSSPFAHFSLAPCLLQTYLRSYKVHIFLFHIKSLAYRCFLQWCTVITYLQKFLVAVRIFDPVSPHLILSRPVSTSTPTPITDNKNTCLGEIIYNSPCWAWASEITRYYCTQLEPLISDRDRYNYNLKKEEKRARTYGPQERSQKAKLTDGYYVLILHPLLQAHAIDNCNRSAKPRCMIPFRYYFTNRRRPGANLACGVFLFGFILMQ